MAVTHTHTSIRHKKMAVTYTAPIGMVYSLLTSSIGGISNK